MKELYIDSHDELIALYLEQHPEASKAEAYEKTAAAAYNRMLDKYADMADTLRQREKETRP